MADSIIIIGGGIAGLTAALSLQRRNKTVRLFEQASGFGEVGAGLTLSQPASRGLFSLGLRSAIEEMADVPVRAGGADFGTGQRLPGADFIAQAREAGEIPYFYQIHRADMHRILSDAVMANDPQTINLGRRLVDLEQDDEGVTVRFADGAAERASVVLGADGINSRVREVLFGPESPRFTGQVAYRFLVPVKDVEPHMHLGPSIVYSGHNRMVLRYVIRNGTTVNAVAFIRTDSWTGEGWSTPVEREELLEKFAGANKDLWGVLEKAPRDSTRKWALFDRDPLESWTRGRVTLLGDAAHPMLPFLGLGAAMGIEDAVVCGRAFDMAETAQDALRIYENTRRDRANYVLMTSRARGDLLQSKDSEERRSSGNDGDLMRYDPSTVDLVA